MFFGCAAGRLIDPKTAEDLLAQYRAVALEKEQKGDLREALQYWKISRSIRPDSVEIKKKIDSLQNRMTKISEDHFKKGRIFYYQDDRDSARREFLRALYFNPDHAGALVFIKERLAGQDMVPYRANKRIALPEIAKEFYKDPETATLIALANGLSTDAVIEQGTLIQLPVIAGMAVMTEVEITQMAEDLKDSIEVKDVSIDPLASARKHFKAHQYKEAASIAESVLAHNQSDSDARELINSSYYALGKKLKNENKLSEALSMFTRVGTGYKDADKEAALLKKQVAAEHYRKGVKYYVSEDLEKAIKEWNTTLSLDPGHPKAQQDIENAYGLLEQLKEMK
jgi:tetratricopeptide (TPR) repeat protein